MKKVLAFAGSARKDSLNKKLVAIAVEGARKAGAEISLIDLADYPMPLYNQDLESEEGMPEKALAFKKLLIEHEGFLIASPEYNSAFSPLLKNAIDWASRPVEGELPLVAFRGKIAALMAASPGHLGGIRGLVALRMLLGNLGMVVLPDQQAIPSAHEVFDEEGSLIEESLQWRVMALGDNLVKAIH
ncbi:MAG: chromate reductase [Cellvibrionaceae bacterium]|jgi:chromate reductase